MDLDEYRKASQDSWERLATAWGRERGYIWETTGLVGQNLVERLDPQPGQTVLELAAGTGDTGFAAAARVGDGGTLISTDFAPAMVEQARRVAGELGLENVEFRVLDAERMDLDDNSVDGVVCRWGYMLMADPAAALAETRRVLREGGRLSFSVWAAPDRNQWASVAGMVLVERGHLPPPEPGAPGIFALADPERIRELVTGAGFGEPNIEPVEIAWKYPDADEHWRLTMELAGPLAEAIRGLDEAEREAVREAVRERIEPLIAGGAGVSGLCHNVLAE
jgi:SAM-dependent methyltransferase